MATAAPSLPAPLCAPTARSLVSYHVPLQGPVRRLPASSATEAASQSSSCPLSCAPQLAAAPSGLLAPRPTRTGSGKQTDAAAAEPGWTVHTLRGSVASTEAAASGNGDDRNCAMQDVREGEYEGGLSVWECSWDLVQFILKLKQEDVAAQHVLDLGCGHGLVGLLMLQRGAGAVVFQDLNAEVLAGVTGPTVALNLSLSRRPHAAQDPARPPAAAESHRMRLCALAKRPPSANAPDASAPSLPEGCANLPANCLLLPASWEAFPSLCCSCKCACSRGAVAGSAAALPTGDVSGSLPGATQHQFDWIVASECIYRPQLFETLRQLLKKLLKRGTGKALIAGKRYYFGIGGGTLPFLHFLRKAETEERERRQQEKYQAAATRGDMKVDCEENHDAEEDALEVSVALTIEDRASNVRDILTIEKRPKP